jgi:hypothetical protein
VDISIGRALFTVTKPMQNVMFLLREETIEAEPLPTAPQHTAPKKRS